MSSQRYDEVQERDLRTLADDIRRGNCILFIGSGVSTEAGYPSAWDIGNELARESDYQLDPSDLPRVALHYERRYGRDRLISKLRSIFSGYSASADVTSYDLIAELPVFTRTVTTNWDRLIEEAFERKRKSLAVIKTEENIPQARTAPYVLIKLHGDFETPPDKIIITEDDYIRSYREVGQVGGLFGLLASWLGTQTLLFVGYSLRDSNFRYLFELVSAHIRQTPPCHFAVVREMDPYTKASWEHKNVRIIEMPARDFFTRLLMEITEFANRDSEVDYVCNLATLPFTEVYGFAGCGKTALLQEVQKQYRLKEPAWYTSLIDLIRREADQIIVNDEFDIIEKLSFDILGWRITKEQLKAEVRPDVEEKARREERIAPEVEIEMAAARRGAEKLGDSFKNRQILLLFDNTERASERVIRWLEDTLVPTLWRAHFEPQAKLRIVFAGRYPISWHSWFIKGKLFLLALSPFDEAAISTMVRSFAGRTIKAPLPRKQQELVVGQVLWLSGGHPRAIRNLLQDLADKKFSVYLPDYFERDRQRLFNEHVFKDVEEEILRDLPDEVRTILSTLCAFRRFNLLTLRELVARKHLDKGKTPQDTLNALRTTHLIREPDESDPMYRIDPVIRYILAQWIEINSPERYIELQRTAAELYDGWIAGPAGTIADAQLLRAYTLESLFHHARLVQLQQEGPENVQVRFQDHLQSVEKRIAQPEHTPAVLMQIRTLLVKDRELAQNLVLALGEDGYGSLFQRIDEFVAGLTGAEG